MLIGCSEAAHMNNCIAAAVTGRAAAGQCLRLMDSGHSTSEESALGPTVGLHQSFLVAIMHIRIYYLEQPFSPSVLIRIYTSCRPSDDSTTGANDQGLNVP